MMPHPARRRDPSLGETMSRARIHHARPLFLAAVLALAAAGCDGPTGPLTVVTYNAGLAEGFVPGAADRSPRTADAIAGLDADVICVQEVWTPGQVADLEAATADAFPHRLLPEPSQQTEATPACTTEDLDPVVSCVEENCDASCVDELVDCMFAHCALPFLGLEKPCMECVQANVGGTPAEIEATCTTEFTHYAYDGAFGTGILSAHPLAGPEEHVFASTTNRRSVLHAVVDAPPGPVDVYCTHLTAVFSTIPYPREEGSWSEEQAAQIDEMLDFVDSTRSAERVVLAGDMNCGPKVGDSESTEKENWNALAASGMAVPYVEAEGECTLCPDNPLRTADADGKGQIIDHVLIEGFSGAATAERVLTEEITSERCGEEIDAAYSDHYGVRVHIEAGD